MLAILFTSKTSEVVSGAAHHVGLKEKKCLALHFIPSKYVFHEHINFGGYHWLITKKIGHVLFFLSINFFPFYFINIYQQINGSRKQKPIV